MALSMGKGRNERGTVQQAHLLKTTRIYSQSNEFMHVCTVKAMKSCTYAGKKAIQPTISKGVCTAQLLTHVLLNQTAPHHADKSKEMATPKDKGGRQGPWTVCDVEPG